MSKVAAIWRREFKGYWFSPVAYILLIVFLVLSTFMFMQFFFVTNNADIGQLFNLIPMMFWFLMPALTMRQWAEERSSGTIELLMTQPITEREAVLGKYLAAVSLLGVTLLLTLPLTFIVAAISQNGLDPGQVVVRYLGALLLGSAFLAIGGWVSSLTVNQIGAFILSIFLIALLTFIGEGFITFKAPTMLIPWLEYIGINRHYVSMARGVVDTRDLLYFASIIFLFLYLTTRAVESRKWS